MKFKTRLIYLILPFFLFLGIFPAARAADFTIDYAAQAFGSPTTLSSSEVEANNLPWQWQALTPAYRYAFSASQTYDPSRPMTIKINYGAGNNYFKQIFAYDQLANSWQPLLSSDVPEENYISASTTATMGQLILLSNPDLMTIGTASWYSYKGGLFAASPDFAKGSVLRVSNLDNGKSVDVAVNDWGPDRNVHPDRVIDLDKVAFQKLASLSEGLVRVKIEPLQVVVSALDSARSQTTGAPDINATEAVVLSEADGRVLWGKNATTVAPLASLTKLVAMRVFFDTRTSLNEVVSYKEQDENYNYQYCQPGEPTLLRVAEGETMTVEDLLYAALVGSANNAVESLVRVSGLSRPEFIKRMNDLVHSWGATATNFVEPTGLSPENVSSPYDYAIISKEVLSNPLLKKVTTTKSYTFKTINTQKSHTLTNTNQMVIDGSYPLTGSKTGYLDEAGYCLMTRVATPTGDLVIVTFGSPSKAESVWDNEQLINYGQRQLAAQ